MNSLAPFRDIIGDPNDTTLIDAFKSRVNVHLTTTALENICSIELFFLPTKKVLVNAFVVCVPVSIYFSSSKIPNCSYFCESYETGKRC